MSLKPLEGWVIACEPNTILVDILTAVFALGVPVRAASPKEKGTHGDSRVMSNDDLY